MFQILFISVAAYKMKSAGIEHVLFKSTESKSTLKLAI